MERQGLSFPDIKIRNCDMKILNVETIHKKNKRKLEEGTYFITVSVILGINIGPKQQKHNILFYFLNKDSNVE